MERCECFSGGVVGVCVKYLDSSFKKSMRVDKFRKINQVLVLHTEVRLLCLAKTTPRSPIFRRNEPSAVMSGLFVQKPVIQHEKGSDGSILLHACANEIEQKYNNLFFMKFLLPK